MTDNEQRQTTALARMKADFNSYEKFCAENNLNPYDDSNFVRAAWDTSAGQYRTELTIKDAEIHRLTMALQGKDINGKFIPATPFTQGN